MLSAANLSQQLYWVKDKPVPECYPLLTYQGSCTESVPCCRSCRLDSYSPGFSPLKLETKIVKNNVVVVTENSSLFHEGYKSTDKVKFLWVQQSTNFHATKTLDINYSTLLYACKRLRVQYFEQQGSCLSYIMLSFRTNQPVILAWSRMARVLGGQNPWFVILVVSSLSPYGLNPMVLLSNNVRSMKTRL